MKQLGTTFQFSANRVKSLIISELFNFYLRLEL